ncbi:hypothetical protein [Bullifex porci]|uniref:hypothetical protein n=1 Tax=Bullifex porci TaxID=2606638 RepID=UPI0023F4D335|nr:hypothetical protein [Bullifex porci]MDD7589466.1 hypothetical protein [Bullifex porci]
MYKIHQKYEDFNGNEREDDFYFNLSKAELLEMELSEEGGMGKRLNNLIGSQDMKEAIKVFKAIVLMSYGVRTDDGRFVKNQEIRDKFTQSAAYSEIFMELATDTDKAQKFINGILPNMGNAIPAPPLPNKHNN